MKTYSTEPEHVAAWDFADFVEVLIVPGVDVTPFTEFDVPYRVHCAHEAFKVNFANPRIEEWNLRCLSEALEAADKLNSPTVVLHPTGDLREGARDSSKELLSRVADYGILLENLPELNFESGTRACWNAEEMREFLSLGFGFCFDFGHAIASAAAQDIDYKPFVERFLALDPHYFHVSNGLVRSEQDLHMPLHEGEFDMVFFRDCILKSKRPEVVLETPFNAEQNLWEYELFKR
jgi:sugar phosphate isomerase/epimerase